MIRHLGTISKENYRIFISTHLCQIETFDLILEDEECESNIEK